MDFLDALALLKAGRWIRRPHWQEGIGIGYCETAVMPGLGDGAFDPEDTRDSVIEWYVGWRGGPKSLNRWWDDNSNRSADINANDWSVVEIAKAA